MIGDAQARLEALRRLLQRGQASTQEELREKLEQADFDVTQSTISRDLKKLGAIRAVDASGRTVYRLPDELDPSVPGSLGDLVREVASNGSLIVIHTAVGSAPLIARHLDRARPNGILGTIAGDDTIFVAPASTSARDLSATLRAIETSLRPQE